MRRREFVALIGASVALPFATRAQQAMPTVGVITPSLADDNDIRYCLS